MLQHLLATAEMQVFHSNELSPLVESVLTHGGVGDFLAFVSDNWDALKTR